MKVFCLAYGSNLHPVRLRKRVPSARLMGTRKLPGYDIAFNKRSDVDASGKANLVRSGNATAYGAVFELEAGEKKLLDQFEGLGLGYHEASVEIELNGTSLDCFVYLANESHRDDSLSPFNWYKRLVIAGAQFHRFPADYIRSLEAVAGIDDPDEDRTRLNAQLLQQMEKDTDQPPEGYCRWSSDPGIADHGSR